MHKEEEKELQVNVDSPWTRGSLHQMLPSFLPSCFFFPVVVSFRISSSVSSPSSSPSVTGATLCVTVLDRTLVEAVERREDGEGKVLHFLVCLSNRPLGSFSSLSLLANVNTCVCAGALRDASISLSFLFFFLFLFSFVFTSHLHSVS